MGHFAECSGVELEWEVMPYAEGGQNAFVHQLRGRITYPNLVLKRGITDDEAVHALAARDARSARSAGRSR